MTRFAFSCSFHSTRRILLTAALVLLASPLAAKADSVTYSVQVDTSSVASSYGYIDLEVNQGTLMSPAVYATVLGYSGGTLNPADGNNDAVGVSGTLPGTLTFDLSTSTDYYEGLTYGSGVSLDVTFDGPGVSQTGSAGGTSGTLFQLSFYDSNGNPILATDPTQPTFVLSADPTGALSTTSNYAGVLSNQVVSPTPEPSPLALLGASMLLMWALRRTRAADRPAA